MNWDEIPPVILASPPSTPPHLTITGALPSSLLDLHQTPRLLKASRRGFIGLLLMDSSPVSIAYPLGARAEIAVKNLSVVPELPTSMTSSGVLKAPPLTRTLRPSSRTPAPRSVHAFFVASVSRDLSGLIRMLSPSASRAAA